MLVFSMQGVCIHTCSPTPAAEIPESRSRCFVLYFESSAYADEWGWKECFDNIFGCAFITFSYIGGNFEQSKPHLNFMSLFLLFWILNFTFIEISFLPFIFGPKVLWLVLLPNCLVTHKQQLLLDTSGLQRKAMGAGAGGKQEKERKREDGFIQKRVLETE